MTISQTKAAQTKAYDPTYGKPHGVLVSDPGDSIAVPTPVGDPADRCFSFTIRNTTIEKDDTVGLSSSDTVFLQSGAVRAGVAVFVVCCRKGKTGNATVDLQISQSSGAQRLSETVTLFCGS